MKLFIDTNIYLSFYHFTSDDLDELGKLAVIMADGTVTLYVPEQVADEFQRNREAKIAQALKQLKGQRLNLQFPQLCKDYSEYNAMRISQKKFEQAHAELLEKLAIDISEKTLKADKTIAMLFEQSSHIPNSDELVQKARLRIEIGRPPGKKDSLGDALNWEALLATVPRENLYFVSDDKDYCSPLRDDLFSRYLEDEWKKTKGSDLRFYKRLSLFFEDMFPTIKLSGELEKEVLIRQLAVSSSFAKTHIVVGKLSNHSGFTVDQLNAILEAYVSNNQVNWILSDPDVRGFIEWILGNRQVLNPDNLSKLAMLMQNEDAQEVVIDDDF